jgi:hypothetical protein
MFVLPVKSPYTLAMSTYQMAIVGLLCGTAGKILIAYTTLMVHHRFRHEHKIDNNVFAVMRLEQLLGLLGILMIIAGAWLELLVIMRLKV